MKLQKTFIEKLTEENSTFSTQRQAETFANLLDTVSSDIYSESQRFVFELIQNADDAAKEADNDVHFDFLSSCLIVSHNGRPFDKKDIVSLTGAGSSTKSTDPTKTGYKGIGFKSVFGKSERVTIFSAGYQFRFDKAKHKKKLPWQIIPIWTEQKDLSPEIQNCVAKNKCEVSTIIEILNVDELLQELIELLANGQILLFLRRISKITVSRGGTNILSIERKVTKKHIHYNEVALCKNGGEISLWLTKTFEQIKIPAETKEELKQDQKTPEKLKAHDYTEISFAASIEGGRLRPLKKEESLIFTFLPTKVSEFEFPFLVNGSFLTNAAREGLHEDRIWNQWLFKLAAQKLIDWLSILAKGQPRFYILQLLPQKAGSSHNALKNAFDRSLGSAISKTAFIPSKSGEIKTAAEVIIDKTGISELSFIAPTTVIEFINLRNNASFKTDALAHSELQGSEKLRAYGATFFEMEDLEDFFLSDIFKRNHQPSENFDLIEYFYNKAISGESRDFSEKLRTLPFLYTEGEKKLKSPQSVCFPSISFSTELGDGVTVIHSEVYTKLEGNSKIKQWLEGLGVKEPSEEAYLENEILGNIDSCIDESTFSKITRYLFNQHKKGLLTEAHYSKLCDLKLFTTRKHFVPARECYLSDFYEPILKLEKKNEAGNYVSEVYKQRTLPN